jgi:putative FmdB family regulatory protein
MPVYDFSCDSCGDFREFLMMDERNRPVACPCCARVSRRVILAPNLALMSPIGRKAAAINEKSRHEPRVSGGHSCGSGCGCKPDQKIRKNRTRETKLGTLQSQKTTARPWMLGH